MSALFHRLRYFCADAWDEWHHSKAVNLLALGTLAAALFLAGIVMLVIGNVDRRIQRLRDDVRVEVYLHDGHDAAERERLVEGLRALDGVARVAFVDKNQALERYRTWAAGMAALIDDLGTNPLPASLEVYLAPDGPAVDRVAAIRRSAADSPAVEEVRFGLDWLRRLESMIGLARAGGAGFGLVVLAAVVVVMASVLRLAVLSRQDEIEIMRLVGASPAFIRGPFLVAGLVSGLVASAIALVLVEGLRRMVIAYAGTGSHVVVDLLAAEPLSRSLGGLLVLVGLFVSLAGSYFAVRENL